MTKSYIPINCNFYDRLEEAATLNKEVELIYHNTAGHERVFTRIKTLFIRDKVEYMIISDETEIRLDRIYSIDGVELQNHC